MSYLRKLTYKIMPEKSYQVIHNCQGCGCKSNFINTNNFRVNANGNAVDVWLIYQCETCKHTLNLTIYERKRPDTIPAKEYKKFLENDKELSKRYGTDKSLFSKNKKVIDSKNISYKVKLTDEGLSQEEITPRSNDLIEIKNEQGIRIRTDKLVASILHMTRSQEKKAEQEGRILLNELDGNKTIQVLLQ